MKERKETARRRFYKNGAMMTALGLLLRTVSLFFSGYVTRTVGAEGMGLYTLIMTVYGFGVTFASAGISLTVTRLVAEALGGSGEERATRVLRAASLYALLFGGAATLVLFFGAPFFAGLLDDPRAALSLRLLSLSLLPIALSSVTGGYFVGVRRVGHSALTQIVSQTARVALTVALLHDGMSAEAACAALAGVGVAVETVEALFLSLLFFADRRRSKKREASERKERGSAGACRENAGKAAFFAVAATALPLALSAYIRSALLTLEHALIPKCLTMRGATRATALSQYGMLHGMALPMVLYPMAVLSSFSGLLVPEFAESAAVGDKKRLSRIASEAMNATLTYAAVAAVLLFLFSEELAVSVYGSHEAGIYTALLSPILPIMYLDHVTDSMLKGIGEQVYSMWVNISDSLLSVLLVRLLIPAVGIGGYALVIIGMEGYNFALSCLRLKKRVPFCVDLLRSAVVPLACAAVSAMISRSLFAMNGELTSPLWLALKIAFAASLTAALLLLLRLPTGKRRGKTGFC